MPMLPNQRHEAFAQALAKGMSASDAYVEAGFSPNRGNAARLNANECITKRVAELNKRASADVVITRQYLLETQQALMQEARDAGEYSAANTALKQLATLAGPYTERQEHEHSGTIASAPMTADEWAAKHAG